MRLNLQTDYALRLLMTLAINDGHLCTIANTAQKFQISRNHLMKVAHILGKEGVIETIRGRTGGLRLAHPADQISVGAIVRLMESDLAIVECFQGGNGDCLITPTCRLKGLFDKAVDAFLDILDQYTIDHLVRRNNSLHSLLTLETT